MTRAWQRMLSGRRLNILEPSALDIEIEDIAHGLSRVARWNGQTVGPYPFSVAAHSLFVEKIFSRENPEMPPVYQLAALLHDSPEYVIGDLISPFKQAISGHYKHIENKLLQAIHIKFGIPSQLPKGVTEAIKKADHYAAYEEARGLAGFSETEANSIFVKPQHSYELSPIGSPDQAKQMFLQRYDFLDKAIQRAR
ncbi:MAG: hydrolase [Alphaproteobacteria bacterium]